MVTLTQNPFFIPAIPFVSFALNLFWGKRLGKASALLSILASAAAALLSVPFTLTVMQGNIVQGNFAWLRVGAGELFFWLAAGSTFGSRPHSRVFCRNLDSNLFGRVHAWRQTLPQIFCLHVAFYVRNADAGHCR